MQECSRELTFKSSMASIKYIETQILLNSSTSKDTDIARCQVYLEWRKKLLDAQIIEHLDNYIVASWLCLTNG